MHFTKLVQVCLTLLHTQNVKCDEWINQWWVFVCVFTAKYVLEGKEVDITEGRKTRSQSKPSPAKPPVKRAGTMQKTAKEGKDYLKRGKGKGKGKKAADDGDKVEEKEEEEEEEKEEAKNDEEDGEWGVWRGWQFAREVKVWVECTANHV